MADSALVRIKTGAVPLWLWAPVLQLAITLPLAYTLNVWQDDAYTLHSTASGIAYAFRESIGFEQNAPLYFVVMDLWRHVNAGAVFARLFSVLCAAAVVAISPALAHRWVPRVSAAAVVLCVALNPFLIWCALEIRVYAFIVLWSALLLLLCWDAFLSSETGSVPAVLFAACVCAALYTQYYLAFLVAALGAAVLIFNRKRFWPYVAACAGGIVPFLPLAIVLPREVANFHGGFVAPSLVQNAKSIVQILAHYVLPIAFVGHRMIVYGLLILAIAVTVTVLRRNITRAGAGLPAVVLTIAAVFFVVATYAAQVHILTRHAASLLLPAVLTPFAGISFLSEPHRRRLTLAWTCLIVLTALGTLFVTYRSDAKPGDWIRVTQYIEQREAPGEPIVVFQAESALPFEYYYRGPNRVVALPKGVNFQTYNVEDFVVRDAQQLSRIMPSSKRIWLVRSGYCSAANISFGCGIVDDYVSRNYITLSSQEFYDSKVSLLLRKGTH